MRRRRTAIDISGGFAGVLDDWLQSHGQAGLVAAAGGSASASRMTLERWKRLVRDAVARVPGPARGLEIAAHVRLSHIGPLGYMAVNASTLRELLETYLLLEKWFYGVNWATASFKAECLEIAWDAHFAVTDRVMEQLHTAALARIVATACPAAGPPLRVDFMNPEAGESAAYTAAFGCPVFFDAPATRFVFSQAALCAPVDIASAALKTAWRSRQRTLREALPQATAFTNAVQSAIMLHLPKGAPAGAVAETLRLSRRTLQRRLSEQGCNYRQLVDGIRERHARQLLEDSSLSRQEVAFLLGYAEQSAFNHAYRRWIGGSPQRTPVE